MPHSGLCNQLFSLMAAVRVARSTGFRFHLPPLLLAKTIGPLCGSCEARAHDGGPAHLQGHTASLALILNLSTLILSLIHI